MKDIRQSSVFAQYMQDLGWKADKIGSNSVYLRKFPFVGFFAKIPHPNTPFNVSGILKFKKSQKIFRLKISPFINDKNKNYSDYRKKFLNAGFKIDHSPFSPTTNFLINLDKDINEIFNNFSEAKRRGVRRAIKNGVVVKESQDLETFIKIRQKQYQTVWFLVGGDMRKLWENLYPRNATLLLAYEPVTNEAVAGILLLFHDKVSYYWFASALSSGKKLFAPTLLVWEALKLSKKRGCKIFDFEGIYDERFPKAGESWKGFTKFKEGFGVKKVVYMENFYI